ncbi:hypothetical protein [Neisseria weixii]|nr:hypothetical protein [Neisseria weixii]ATD64614.1 hypothetical protein CGZ65_03515 [Neisseria weixii]
MTQLANEQNLKMDYSKVDAEMWNMANALSVPHSKRYEGHLIDVPPNKEMLGRMMDKVIQEPTQSQNLQIQFEQLDKVYQENQHLLSPKQKLIIHEAEKIIQQLPPQAQLQAKVNLYQSVSEDIQKHPNNLMSLKLIVDLKKHLWMNRQKLSPCYTTRVLDLPILS